MYRAIKAYFCCFVCCILLQEWESHLKILFGVLSTERDEMSDSFTNEAKEKIPALYGVDAENKSFEDLKSDDKFAEITKQFSSSNVSYNLCIVTFQYIKIKIH